MPCLRGGGEFGAWWYLAGALDRKQNVFDDFIAAAEWLIARGYTSPSRLAISGCSNGGLLVGAAITQRPDLFRAAICRHPLLDMVRYHQFRCGKRWVPEYGSPDDPKQFQYLHAYSPYHRIRQGEEYPAALFVTGDADTRVDPLHACKMAARLQAATASDRPVLFQCRALAGHATLRPISAQIEDTADELAFLCWQLGVSPIEVD
jgi:prolyl oligopeptidase